MDTVKLAYAQVQACLAQAGTHYGREFWISEVRFDLTGTTAGQFVCSRDQKRQSVRINRVLLDANAKEMLDTIIPHEVAHLVACQLYGPSIGHGPKWRAIMTDCYGLPPDRCHNLDTSISSSRPFLYRCRCNTFELSKRMHNSIQRGSTRRCSNCKHTLEFSHETVIEKPVLRMESLFVAASDNNLSPDDIQRLTGLVGNHQVDNLVLPAGLTGPKRRLLKALSVPASSCREHARTDTLPGGLTHAILLASRNDARMKRAASVLRGLGVKVRFVERG